MRDEHARFPTAQQCLVDIPHQFRLSIHIQRARRLVKEQDGRVFQQQSCHCQTLFLSSRDHQTSLSDLCGILIGQPIDRLVNLGFTGGLEYLFVGRFQIAVSDIVENICVEQWCILRDDTNGFSERCELDVFDVLPINQDTTRAGIVESEKKSEHCRLSASRGSDNSDFLSGGYGK